MYGLSKPVKQDTVLAPNGKHYFVSTISLPIDHGDEDDPLWYETMVFPSDGAQVTDWLEIDCVRYATEEQALAGHDVVKSEWEVMRDE